MAGLCPICRAPPRAHYPVRVRALLIVNPRATSTTPPAPGRHRTRPGVRSSTRRLETRYRGHATKFAGEAAPDGYGLVLTLGGDGTVNEAVNGMLRGLPPEASGPADLPGPGRRCRAAARTSSPGARPAADPVDATGQILARARRGPGAAPSAWAGRRTGTSRSTPGSAWTPRSSARSRACARMARRRRRGFTCGPRCASSTASPTGASPRSPWNATGSPADRPVIPRHRLQHRAVDLPGQPPVNPSPQAGFDTGLDLFAAAHAVHAAHVRALCARCSAPGRASRAGRHIVSLHDEQAFVFRAIRPSRSRSTGSTSGNGSLSRSVRFRSAASHCLEPPIDCTGWSPGDRSRALRQSGASGYPTNVTYLTPKSGQPLPQLLR